MTDLINHGRISYAVEEIIRDHLYTMKVYRVEGQTIGQVAKVTSTLVDLPHRVKESYF